ncbi:MAG: ABC transporter ATP-binding protein/permease [Treponema sp.]|jgi:ATP-binding cassette subfamily B protein|nr:ABC transporter ATP-binding protein/permease [Treponema sp.]
MDQKPPSKLPKKSTIGEFRTILPYLRRYRTAYGLGFFFLIAVDAAQAVIPQFIRQAVDMISTGHFSRMEVFRNCLAMLAVMALVASGRFLWRYFIHGSSRRIETELRDDLFSHLLSLSYDFYQKNKIGDLMARAVNDIGAVRNSLGWGVVTLVDGTVMAASILVIIFIQDPRTAAFCVLPLPPITAVMLFFGRMMGRRFHRAQETYSAMSDTVQETFAGIRVVKSFVKEWWFNTKFEKANDDYRDANMDLVKIYGAFFPLVSFLAGLTTIILLLIGGRRVVTGYLSPGELVALFSYLQMLIWPLMGAGFMVNMIQRGAAGMGRINELLKTEPSIGNPVNPRRGGSAEGSLIELRNLSFHYPRTVLGGAAAPAFAGGNKGPDTPAGLTGGNAEAAGIGEPAELLPVLEGISLSIPRGTVLGILGRTGSGKSTLLKTLTRMVDPPAGTVFVEGLDVRERDLRELRRLFGVSPQDSYLFSDTIKNNIAYGGGEGEESGAEALAGAAELSALERDLESFALGWDTLIGERGLTLSGGQKQRVAIARALVSAPEILILDDAFSAVDAETEKRILLGLLKERHGSAPRSGSRKTTIIVSQRVSTLGYADLVAVLEGGRLSELGSPGELLAAGRFFARMAELQRLGEEVHG